jgi:hypothetical protein
MRQHLTPQELDEHFTVLPQEHTLLAQKSPAQRLGCAILLRACFKNHSMLRAKRLTIRRIIASCSSVSLVCTLRS